jgi:hypothetical protein
VLGDERHQRTDVGRGRGDRDGDGEGVVDEQGAGDGQSGVLAEVHRRDLVVAPAGGIGADVLPVAGHDRQQDDDDGETDPRRHRVRGDTGDRQGQEDLLGGVGDRRHGVGGEHGEGDPLREQGAGQAVAALRSSDHEPLESDGELGHGGAAYAPAPLRFAIAFTPRRRRPRRRVQKERIVHPGPPTRRKDP